MRHLSPRARGLATAMFVTGGALLGGAPRGSAGAGWVSMLIATAAGLLVCVVLGLLGSRAGDREFFTAADGVLGGFGGGAVAAVLGVLALGMMVRDMAVVTQFIGANMITETPRWLIAISLAATAAWCASCGRSTVGRWVELAALVAGVSLVICLAATVGDFDARAVVDGLKSDADGIFGGAVGLFSECAGSVLLLASTVFPFGKAERRRASPLVAGLVIGGALLAVVMLFNVALLGAETLDIFNFPTYHALRISGIGGVLERMEPLLMIPAVATGIFRVAAELMLIIGAVERFCPKMEGSRSSAFVIAAVGVAASLILLPSQVELRWAEGAFAVGYAIALAAVTLLIGSAALFKKRG